MIEEKLVGLGLTQNEAKVYMVLLNKGEMSVNIIGSRSGLHRQVCYDALDRLVEKGFVSFVEKDGRKVFKALDPRRIIDYLEDKKNEIDAKKQDINKILPNLEKMFSSLKEDTKVEVIKGKNVLRTIYNDIFSVLIEKKGFLYAMGIEETKFLEFDEIAIKQHIKKLRKNRLKEKLLSKISATHFFEGQQSEYRLVPDHLFNPNPTHVYGNKIAIIVWGNPAYGIIIDNRYIADANKKYFKMLWKIGEKRKSGLNYLKF